MGEVRALTTDAVIVSDGQVVLLKRNHPPCEGMWVLPGGYVEQGETAREACTREAREEVGLAVETIEFVGLYDDPARDERGNVSAAYRCHPLDKTMPSAEEESNQVDLFDPTDLPEMGFDHEQIVADAVETQ